MIYCRQNRKTRRHSSIKALHFSNESSPLHDIFPSELNVYSTKLPYNIYSRLVCYSNENQLYFIPVFLYTFNKVKSNKGEEMAAL